MFSIFATAFSTFRLRTRVVNVGYDINDLGQRLPLPSFPLTELYLDFIGCKPSKEPIEEEPGELISSDKIIVHEFITMPKLSSKQSDRGHDGNLGDMSEGLIEHPFDETIGVTLDDPRINNETPRSYCHTEDSATGPPNQLCVGLGHQIPRWAQGSVIKYIVRTGTFPSDIYAKYAADCLEKAGNEWNNKLGGIGPRFEPVSGDDAAVCELMYKARMEGPEGPDGGPLADAFFPDSKERIVYVYAKAFEDGFRDSMTNIFYHELGHVLGLRHEFALEREKKYGAVCIGPRNEFSVMNYFHHPSQLQIHDLDVRSVKEFYNIMMNEYGGLPIRDYIPQSLSSRRRVLLQTKILDMVRLAGSKLGLVAIVLIAVVGITLAGAKICL